MRSQWALRVHGGCINPKGAHVSFEIYAPPLEAIYETGFVKVCVDSVCVYRKEWDGYLLGAERCVRDEVLKSRYWKWIESRYEANLRLIEEDKRNDLAADAERAKLLYGAAINRL